MFKIIFFLWRKDGLSSEQFAEYYENRHAPLGASLSPPMTDYRRNYPKWRHDVEATLGGFDVMTEIWHDARATFEKQLKTMQVSPAKEIISEDEARFIDRGRQLFVTVDEHSSSGEAQGRGISKQAGTRLRKIVRFVRAPRDLDSAAFLAAYERQLLHEHHGELANFVDYRRNYALFDDPFSFAGGHHKMTKPDESVRFFDLIEELWLSEVSEESGALLDHISSCLPSLEGSQSYCIEVEERRSPGGRRVAPFNDQ
jgi:hypothetical protein